LGSSASKFGSANEVMRIVFGYADLARIPPAVLLLRAAAGWPRAPLGLRKRSSGSCARWPFWLFYLTRPRAEREAARIARSPENPGVASSAASFPGNPHEGRKAMIVCVGISHKETRPSRLRGAACLGRRSARRPRRAPGSRHHRRGSDLVDVQIASRCTRRFPRGTAPTDAHFDEGGPSSKRGPRRARGGPAVTRSLHRTTGRGAVRHLFRVGPARSIRSSSASLRFFGQLKDAMAPGDRASAPWVRFFSRALRRATSGRQAREGPKHRIGGRTSEACRASAVELALSDLRRFCRTRAPLLVGAGEMAESAAKLLLKEGRAVCPIINRKP